MSEHSLQPVPSFVVNSGLKNKFDIHMKRAKSNEKKYVVIIRGICPVNSFGFLTLRDGMWLSDSVIEAFAQKMLIKSKHEDGHRFFLLSSLYIQYIQSGLAGRNSFRRAVREFDVYSVDYVLWSLHVINHWCLVLRKFTRVKFIYLILSILEIRSECLRAFKIFSPDRNSR